MTKLYSHDTIPDGAYAVYIPPDTGKIEAVSIYDDWNGLLYCDQVISNGDNRVMVPTSAWLFDTETDKEKWLLDKTTRDGYYLFCHRGEASWLPYLNKDGSKGHVLDWCVGLVWSEQPLPLIEYGPEEKPAK